MKVGGGEITQNMLKPRGTQFRATRIDYKTNMSLKKRIENYVLLKGDRWTSGTEIEDRAREVGKKSSNASRRCRELVEENIFERRLNSRGCVEYRYKNI